MKSLAAVIVSLSFLATLPAHADEIRERAPRRIPIQIVEVPKAPQPAPRPPKQAPIPVPYEIADSMTGDEVLAIAAEEYALLSKLIGEYGRRPEFSALEKAADAHFREGTRRLAREVSDILSRGTIGPAAAPTFEQQIEALGKEVSAILSQGSIGSNAPRYSQTATSSGAKPATGTPTGKAIGAGMARD